VYAACANASVLATNRHQASGRLEHAVNLRRPSMLHRVGHMVEHQAAHHHGGLTIEAAANARILFAVSLSGHKPGVLESER
jgi:hypothetical protein